MYLIGYYARVQALLAEAKTLITLLSNGKLNTLALGEADPSLGGLTNDGDVRETGGEGVLTAVLEVDNVETTMVTLTVNNGTDTANAVSTSDNGNVTTLKLDKGLNLVGLQVKTDGVVDADQRIRVTDGTAVVGHNEGDTLGTNLHLTDLAELVLGLLIRDTVDNKASLNVVKDAEVLTSLLDLDDIHETGGVVDISANLAINLDVTLHNNGVGLTLVQSILQTVADENNKGQALTELVRTRRRTRGLQTISRNKENFRFIQRCRKACPASRTWGRPGASNACGVHEPKEY